MKDVPGGLAINFLSLTNLSKGSEGEEIELCFSLERFRGVRYRIFQYLVRGKLFKRRSPQTSGSPQSNNSSFAILFRRD